MSFFDHLIHKMKKSPIQKPAIKMTESIHYNIASFSWEGKFRKCLILSDLCLNSLQSVIALLAIETSWQKNNNKYNHGEEPKSI